MALSWEGCVLDGHTHLLFHGSTHCPVFFLAPSLFLLIHWHPRLIRRGHSLQRAELLGLPVPTLVSGVLSPSWWAVYCCHHPLAWGLCSLITKRRHSFFPKAQLRPDWYVIQTLLQVRWGQWRGLHEESYLLWAASCGCSWSSSVSGAFLRSPQLVALVKDNSPIP